MYVSRELRDVFFYLVLAVLGLHELAPKSTAQTEYWTSVADMPTARLGLAAAVVNGKLYGIGGYPAANSPGLTTIEEYDPMTDSWTAKAEMPTRRRWLAASAVDRKIYAIGGFETAGSPELPTVEAYDIATDTWETKAPMPTPRKGLTTAVLDGMIYAIGGASPSGKLTTVEMYDPMTDLWTSKASMLSSTSSASVINGKIYGLGGILTSGTRTVQEYDPATDTWTRKADMPTARGGMTTSTVDGIIYAMGGITGQGGTTLSTFEKYDPVADQWTVSAGMPRARWGLASSAIDGQIYAVGGATGAGSHPGIRTVEKYDVHGAEATKLPVVELSILGEAYTQDFDEALGSNERRTGVLLPNGWLGKTEHIYEVVDGRFNTRTVLREGSFFNAGQRSDDDRTLALRVPRRGEAELEFSSTLKGSDAAQLRLQFDLEAWGAASLRSSAPAGEAAFHVLAEVDSGNGFEELLDLGTVTTGANLVVPDEGHIDGNQDAFRKEFDSGWLNDVRIAENSTLRLRWIAESTSETKGWTYGVDNVQLDVGILGDVNRDGMLGVDDVDLVSHEVWNPSDDLLFDLTSDASVDQSDVGHLLELTNRINGDADFDGEVQFSDFLILSDNFGQADGSWSAGDFDSDGLVGFSDFLILSNNFGESAPLAASVPEPSGVGVGMIAIALVGTLRRRRERGRA